MANIFSPYFETDEEDRSENMRVTDENTDKNATSIPKKKK